MKKLVYTMFITKNHPLFEGKICGEGESLAKNQKVSKYYDHDYSSQQVTSKK